MTTNGHKHHIKHPGYGESSSVFNRSMDFVFSDNIEKWMGTRKVKYMRKVKEERKRK